MQGSPRMDELVRQSHVGARSLAPGGFTNAFAFDLLGVEKIADAVAEPAQEQARRRCPMPREESGLVDDAETDLPACQDRTRALAAPARVEIVAVEIEQHDARSFDPFEQWIEPRRIATPRIVKLIEIAKRGGCRRHDRIHLFGR